MKLHHLVNRKEQENMSVFLYSGQDYLKTILIHLPEKVIWHSVRVAKISSIISKHVPKDQIPEGMDREIYRLALYKAAYYHEIGILIARNNIEQRQIHAEKLMQNSWEVASEAAPPRKDVSGEKTMISPEQVMIETVRSCREQYNGQGYPDALAKENIPLHANICAIADIVDMIAYNSNKPTKRKAERAIDFIHQNSGTMFRPDAVNYFGQAQEELRVSFGL